MWNKLNPYEKLGVGTSAGASAGNALFGLFGRQNPSDAASSYFDQIPETIKPYYQPYIDSGNQARGNLSELYSSILKNPGNFLNNLGKGYQKSPGYDFERGEGLNAINQSSAAGGMLGGPQNQEQAGQYATQFANKDYSQFLSHLFDILGLGESGERNMFNTGYQASSGLADNLASNLMTQGNLAYTGAANENNNNSSIFGDLGSLATLFGLWPKWK